MKNDLLPRNEWWKIRFLNAALDLARSYTCLKAFALRFLGTQVWEEFNLVFDVFVLVFVKGGKKSFSILVNLNTEIFFRKIWELITHVCWTLFQTRVWNESRKNGPRKIGPRKNDPRKIGPRETQKRKIEGWASSIVVCVCGMWSIYENPKLENKPKTRKKTRNTETKNRGVNVKHRGMCVECSDVINLWKPRTRQQTQNSEKSQNRKPKVVGWALSIVVCVWNVRMWSIYENSLVHM